MTRHVHKAYPALRKTFALTYLPCNSPHGTYAGMLVLGDGTPFVVAATYPTPYEAASAIQASYQEHLLNLAEPEGVFSRLSPWKHTPDEADQLSKSFGLALSGIPVAIEIPIEVCYQRLVRDAKQGFVKLLNPAQASKALQCSRQNIHHRFKTKSLTPIHASDLTDGTEMGHRKTIFCLADEIRAEVETKAESHVP